MVHPLGRHPSLVIFSILSPFKHLIFFCIKPVPPHLIHSYQFCFSHCISLYLTLSISLSGPSSIFLTLRIHYPPCIENPLYVLLFWELRGLSPSFHIHVSVSDLNIPRIGPNIWLQQNTENRQTDPRNI